MKNLRKIIVIISALALLTACGIAKETPDDSLFADAVKISLSDEGITTNGETVTTDTYSAVYTANDIVYYEEGKDFTYGEGTDADAHSKEEADAHTVVHIAKPGTYSLSGKLSQGQIAIDLGEDAKENPEAKVTLILNGADITCTVAPAIIFYNVYECGSDDTETATKDVDTTSAGANVIIADSSENTVNGSYVARIYKADTVELSEDGTEVADAKKLHKYDAAFYSKMSMNVSSGEKGTGVLNIGAENEGLDSELHLTINGGNINIKSGNDGINTNEDNVSVTTVNGGNLNIVVTGETGEGDGIDSNGWLVINGGTVTTSACNNSADAGIDSDLGIHISGGTVISTGHMLDRIEDGGQTYAVFNFASVKSGEEVITLKNSDGKELISHKPVNAYSILIYSSPELTAGDYTLWSDGKQLQGSIGGMMGGHGMRPGGMEFPEGERPEMPEGEIPEGFTPPEKPENGEMPEGFTPPEMPEGQEPPEGFDPADRKEPPTGENGEFPMKGERPEMPFEENSGEMNAEMSEIFKITDKGNMFGGITAKE